MNTTTHMRYFVAINLLLFAFSSAVRAEDWPMHRKDRLRTAVTTQRLELPLKNAWMFRSRVSWKAPPVQRSTVDRESPNALFNGRHTWSAQATPDESRWALPITSAGESLFFTSHDGRIVCLSTQTGEVRWQFLTGAAIAQAANFYEGRVYAGSDDGYVYCLNADNGQLIWKYKAAPADRWLISYDRMASLWPVRTDVLLDSGVAYFAAGVFPHDGIYVHAVRADNGQPVWQKGGVPYAGGGISGYPVLTKDVFHCPVDLKGFNRSPVFRRSDGVYDWTAADPEKSSVHFGHGDGRAIKDLGVFRGDIQYIGHVAIKHEAPDKATTLWSQETEPGRWHDTTKIILAGDTLFYLADDKSIWGGAYPLRGEGGTIIARDASTGKQTWSFDIPERPHHIIAANGRLFVSTRHGSIYCFAPQRETGGGIVNEPLDPEPFERTPRWQESRNAVQRITEASDAHAGYAVVLDCDDGLLAYQLAAMTDLYVVAVFADADKAQAARERFARADLHGSQIIVWHGSPKDRLPVPSRVADLVTSEATLAGGALPASLDEVMRMLKPIRGKALFMAWQQKETPADWQAVLQQRAEVGETWTPSAMTDGWCVTYVRPPLEGAGSWAGRGGGPENTNNSHDAALKGPLGVVWYGAPSVRNSNEAPPLVASGVLMCPTDDNTLTAHDQYNGRLLWELSADGIGLCVFNNGVAGGNHLYTIREGRCLRVQLYEGGRLVEIPTPFASGSWTNVSVSRDGKTLWGAARAVNEKKEVLWTGIFAIDTQANRTLWTLGGPDAKDRQWQSWNAIGDGRMYIINPISDTTRQQAIDETRDYLAQHFAAQVEGFDKEVAANQRALRTLTAVDAQTGALLYDHGIDMTHNAIVAAHADFVICMASHGLDRHRKNPMGGPVTQGLGVWEGKTGKLVWKRPGEHSFTPVVAGGTIYAEPWAYDLKTGEHVKRLHPVNGAQADFCWARKGKHCGGYSGSEHFLFGRNMGVGYYDTQRDNGMYTFWHSRVSCGSDVATGGGMMIKPPYALGCSCPWSLPFTVALAPADHEPEASFEMALPGDALPVKHVRINCGAEGERRDHEGNLWIRPGRQPHGMFTHVEFLYSPKSTYYPGVTGFQAFVRRSNIYTDIENTDLDFVFASGERGVQKCVIPLTRPDDAKASYTLRIGFCGLPGEQVGQRVFDIRLNGKTVEEKFDAIKVAGGPDRAIWREFALQGEPEAVLEFVSPEQSPSLNQVPIVNAMEVIRQSGN